MKTTIGFGSVLALAMTALACGKPAPEASSTLKVSGAIDTRSQSLDNASAVAIGSDGRTFSAYLQRNGRFTLELPVGHVYRILIANSTMSGQLRPIGHLVNPTSRGKADVIAVKKGGSLNLGTLRPAGASSNALKVACDCPGEKGDVPPSDGDKGSGDDGYGDKDDGYGDGKTPTSEKDGDYGDKSGGDGDDYKCQQKDEDKDRVCDSSSDVELEATNSPGDKCAMDDEDQEAPKPKGKACSTKDEDKDGKDDDSSKGPPSDDGYGDKGSPSDEGSGDKGSGDKGGDDGSCSACAPPPPSSCTCSAQCGKGASCVASKCVADKSGGTPSK